MKQKYLIVIGGATASGKTAVAIGLAQHFETSILSCDSRQFYREMSIGTAKPSEEELATVPHHFIDSLSVEKAYHVGDYERDALQCLEGIYAKQDVTVLAGGSGLFIRALCEGLDEFPNVPAEVRAAVEGMYEEQGLVALQSELQERDPVHYARVDLQNPHRLIRALSVCRASGKAYSSFLRQTPIQRSFQPIYISLKWERTALYERINRRVDMMVAAGLVEEAKDLFPKRALTALQTVGYQELFAHFEGKTSLEEAIELIKRNSRRYAKRQLTWFRRDPHWTSFAPTEQNAMIEHIESIIAR